MPEVVTAQITTKNKKGFTFQGFEGADANEVGVQVDVQVPESFAEAASSDFYGSEEAAVSALKEDWKRRCVNAARPILRDAESEMDWQTVSQQAVDSYKPGRRGGFTPRVGAEELEQFEVSDELRAFLSARGLIK